MRFLKSAILFGAMLLSGAAYAVGTPPLPGSGFAVPDSQWLNGVAGGQNSTFQSGLTAAGTGQSTALQLGAGIALFEIDTVAGSTGVALPPAVAGTELSIYNNGSNTLAVYPAIANNALTSAQDTINNGTNFSGGVSNHTALYCFAAKNGIWACK